MDENAISNPFEEEKPRSSLITVVIFGILLAGCCVAFLTAFVFFKPDQLSLSDRYFPSPTSTLTPTQTSTPTNTPTPTLSPTPTATPTAYLLLPPAEDVTILEESFDSNKLKWNPFYADSTLDIRDGKLYLRSNTKGYVGLSLCDGCPLYDKAFYYQAEVTLAKKASIEHGLAFCATGYSQEYYVFQVDSSNQFFYLYKNTPSGWVTLLNGVQSDFIYKYPSANTLGVRFDQGLMQLYINGIPVTSYTDPTPPACRRIGLYINDGPVDVIADNVFAYQIAVTPVTTPTP